MERIRAVDNNTSTEKRKALLDNIQAELGMIPNFMRIMVNSPAALKAYLNFSAGLEGGSLSPRLREQIALMVSEFNDSGYCLAIHTAIGRMVGLSEEDVVDCRKGISSDGKEGAALLFAGKVLEKRGKISDEDISCLHRAGYSDGDITEIIANVALNIFTNYFNLAVGSEVDFPEVASIDK